MSKNTYKARFENLLRLALKITSSLNIGEILEIIRDEARITVPHAREACLLMFDPEAQHYTRPLHCSVYENRINCQLCKRGQKSIQEAIERPLTSQCLGPEKESALSKGRREPISEIVLPIHEGDQILAVLNVIAEDGSFLSEEDIVLLEDLVGIATNAIANAKKHWEMSQKNLTLDLILERLKPFVPKTVQLIVEKDPANPYLGKSNVDVSILFLDVAGYTKISEDLTHEKVNFIIEKYFSSFLDIIYSHGGDINETAGDGLMVIFQDTDQQHAFNAARAALDVHARTNEINRELKGRFEPIHVNMGINSGLTSIGVARYDGAAGTRMTFTATGPVTNLAARIASAAIRGDILLGPETARRIKGKMRVYSSGLRQFKNFRKPVKVFSLLRSA